MHIAIARLIINFTTALVLVYAVYKIPRNGYVVVGIKCAFLAIALQKVLSSSLFVYSMIFGGSQSFGSYYAIFDFVEIPPVLFLALSLSGFVGYLRLKFGIVDNDEKGSSKEPIDDIVIESESGQ